MVSIVEPVPALELMRYEKLHRDEFGIDDALLDRLLAQQMPQWAALPRHSISPLGTDNVMIRLGDMLAVRLPRTPQASAALTKEQRFLPLLAPHLSLEIPAPIGFGEPDAGYPCPWSVCPWIAGRNPEPGEADIALAGDLADFARTLHQIDTFAPAIRRAAALLPRRFDPVARCDYPAKHRCMRRITRSDADLRYLGSRKTRGGLHWPTCVDPLGSAPRQPPDALGKIGRGD